MVVTICCGCFFGKGGRKMKRVGKEFFLQHDIVIM
ncbi:fatty acid hydroxylase, partial [Bacillus mobilis]